MFSNLLFSIKHNHQPLSLFKKYNGTDWINHIKMEYGCSSTTLFYNKFYKLEAHHWLDTYTLPTMSFYTGLYSTHTKILVGNAKLVALLPEHSTYSITLVDQYSYSRIPPDSEWIILAKSKMLYYLSLTIYK